MIKILFICHGNICRSPMAEYLLRFLAAQRGEREEYRIGSAGTSAEESGHPVHPETRRTLAAHGVPCGDHHAVQLTRADYDRYDLLLGMDTENLINMYRILGGDPDGKLHRLLDFAPRTRDIADPWYTGNFDDTYRDILEGCNALLDRLAPHETTMHKEDHP